MADVARTGFTLLSQKADPDLQRFNIIFIHGLRGHPRRTWLGEKVESAVQAAGDPGPSSSKRRVFKRLFQARSAMASRGDAGNTPTHVFWLEELLAHDIPEARVWTYGYNADVIGGLFQANNKNNVTQHSRDLAAQLERDINNEDPIIFVAHSLGGIVVKDALQRSENSRSKTIAIIFLGTPHRGSEFSGWGTVAANLAKLALQDSNDMILRDLDISGEILDRIDEEFKNLVQKNEIRIHSFQEGRGISGIKGFEGKVVEDFSSKLGLPDETEKVETIDADHRQMVRCNDRADPKYKAICGVLELFIRNGSKTHCPEAALSLVLRESQVILGSQPQAQGQGRVGSFLLPYPRNAKFVGRQSTINSLLNQAMGDIPEPRTGLFGLGGVGKTQIAIEYAYALYEARPTISVFWVFAATEQRFKEAYSSIAQHFKVPGYDDPRMDVLQLVQKWLCDKSNGHWLMIVDNADDFELMCNQPHSLQQYLPDCSHGLILITTRNKQVAVRLTKTTSLLAVPPMDVEESVDLLRDKLCDPRDCSDLEQLALRLEHLPLALIQAALFMQGRSISVQQYLALIDESDDTFTELLGEDFETIGRSSDTPHALTKTWVVSFNQIQQQDPLASNLLCLMSFYDRQSIPTKLLYIYLQYINYTDPSAEHQDIKTSGSQPAKSNFKFQSFWQDLRYGEDEVDLDPKHRRELTNALGVLKAFSFISEGKHDTYTMHRLTQLVTRNWLSRENESRKDHFRELATITVSSAFPPYFRVMENMATCSKFLPHALSVLEFDRTDLKSKSESLAKALLYEGLCEFYRWSGRLDQAERAAFQAIGICQNALGKEHNDTLRCISLLLYVRGEQKRLQEAESLALEILEIRKRIYGENDIGTIHSMMVLADVLSTQNRYKEEIEVRENIRQRLEGCAELGVDWAIVTNMVNLGNAYQRIYNYQQAEAIHLEVVEMSKSLSKKDEVLSLDANHALGVTYRLMNDFEKSEAIIKSAIEGRRRCLGEAHRETLESSWHLAELYCDLERYDEAEKLSMETFQKRKQTLGGRNNTTLYSMSQLGKICLSQGRVEEAVEMLQKCYDIQKEAVGDTEYDTLLTLCQLCRGWQRVGRSKEAISTLDQFYQRSLCVHGKDHRNTLCTAWELAGLYCVENEFDKAEKLEQYLFETQKRQLGEDNPETLKIMHDLATTLKEQERVEEAIDLLKTCYYISQHTLGPGHHDVIRRAEMLAGWCWEQGQYDETEELERSIFDTRRTKLGENHPETLSAMNDLAFTWSEQGRSGEAIGLMKTCCHISQQTLGPGHDDVIRRAETLARWCWEQRRYGEILSVMKYLAFNWSKHKGALKRLLL
ncbi:hypothetical protein QBC44DRAFT_324600 [Cladorrhinum sp. PSN332]|nr:hypothetical protein QBC44DRAFT_324600 [Cladorrhinum sp. PSN332]